MRKLNRLANFCKDCINWKEAFTRYESEVFGICNSVEVIDEVVKEVEESSDKDGVVYTQARFGCIHFRKTENVLIDISKTINKND